MNISPLFLKISNDVSFRYLFNYDRFFPHDLSFDVAPEKAEKNDLLDKLITT
jgi:hypothetical protein